MKINQALLVWLVSGAACVGAKRNGAKTVESTSALTSSSDSPSASPTEYPTATPKSKPVPSPNVKLAKLDSTLQGYVTQIDNHGRRVEEFEVPPGMLMSKSGMVTVDVRGKSLSNANLRSVLEKHMGFRVTGCFDLSPSRCSVLLDIHDVPRLTESSEILWVQANFMQTNVGSVESEASQSMFADEARLRFGVDGSGVKVCVMSDSFNCAGPKNFTVTDAAQDVLSGDLPPFERMDILRDVEPDDAFFDFCFIDEGRGMMQLIHDVAPGADLGFYTAALGLSAMAEGIMELVGADCDIIVDDILYVAEAAFQDDVIAQAVDYAVDMGVAYFSSAGNFDRFSWEGEWMDTSFAPLNSTQVMDFTDGQGGSVPFLRVSLSGTAFTGFAQWLLQWADPVVTESGGIGPRTDINFYVFQNDTLVASSTTDAITAGNTFEQIVLFADGVYDIVLERVAGPPPELVKLWFPIGRVELDPINGDPDRLAAPSIFGHPNARGAIAVGAADYTQTPGFGVSPAVVQLDSSAGGVPILFDTDGTPLDQAEIRMSPAVVGPDNTCTSFFLFPDPVDPNCYRFPGSSAAAPNVAAIAALMLEAQPRLQPGDIRSILTQTAEDMDDPFTPWFDYGFDFATGNGFVNALFAVEQASMPLSKMKDGKKSKRKLNKSKKGKGGKGKMGKKSDRNAFSGKGRKGEYRRALTAELVGERYRRQYPERISFSKDPVPHRRTVSKRQGVRGESGALSRTRLP